MTNIDLINPYVIDTATGLPTLPEGWVWKVKPWVGGAFDYQVAVMIKREFGFGRYESRFYWNLFDGHEEKDLQDAARIAVIAGNDRLREETKKKNAAPLAGVYPPNRVGEGEGGVS